MNLIYFDSRVGVLVLSKHTGINKDKKLPEVIKMTFNRNFNCQKCFQAAGTAVLSGNEHQSISFLLLLSVVIQSYLY